jgi:hypothetical protein
VSTVLLLISDPAQKFEYCWLFRKSNTLATKIIMVGKSNTFATKIVIFRKSSTLVAKIDMSYLRFSNILSEVGIVTSKRNGVIRYNCFYLLRASVTDPDHFDLDPDPTV